jgi:hypothetical protein
MTELSDFDGLKMRGRVLQISTSPRGSVIFIIKAHTPTGRGRFFGHEAECDATYTDPRVGDLVEFFPKAPNKEMQMPKATCIRKVTT